MMQRGCNVKYVRIPLLLLLVVLISVFCTTQKSVTEEGTRIVHNVDDGKWGDYPRVSLELARTFGGLDVDDENYVFVGPRAVVMDSNSNIYLLDSLEHKINKYSSDGAYLQTIGKLGQGPGDFNGPYSLDIDGNDKLYVLEGVNRRIQILTGSGEYLSQINLDKLRMNIIRVLESGFVAMGGQLNLRWALLEQSELPGLINIMDKDGDSTRSVGDMKDFGVPQVKFNTDEWYVNQFKFDIDGDNNFYLSFLRQNRIKKFDKDGNLVWEADRQMNYSTEIQEDGYIKTPEGGVMYQSPIMNEVSRGIALDSKQRIWVLTMNRQFEPGEQTQSIMIGGARKVTKQGIIKNMDIYRLEIYQPDGVLLGKIMLNHLADGLRIQNDCLFVWEMENAIFYQYRIVEN